MVSKPSSFILSGIFSSTRRCFLLSTLGLDIVYTILSLIPWCVCILADLLLYPFLLKVIHYAVPVKGLPLSEVYPGGRFWLVFGFLYPDKIALRVHRWHVF